MNPVYSYTKFSFSASFRPEYPSGSERIHTFKEKMTAGSFASGRGCLNFIQGQLTRLVLVILNMEIIAMIIARKITIAKTITPKNIGGP